MTAASCDTLRQDRQNLSQRPSPARQNSLLSPYSIHGVDFYAQAPQVLKLVEKKSRRGGRAGLSERAARGLATSSAQSAHRALPFTRSWSFSSVCESFGSFVDRQDPTLKSTLAANRVRLTIRNTGSNGS